MPADQWGHQPTVERHGTGWSIPVAVTAQTGPDGGTYWAGVRLQVASLAHADVAAAVAADPDATAGMLPEAAAAAYTTSAGPQQVADLATVVYAAKGGDGRAWQQPLGAFDAYPLGAVVTYQGQTWQSLIAANVWAPGTAGLWELASPVTPPDPPAAAAWAAGVAYKVGDRVTYQGTTYVCVQAHTSQVGWEPPSVPALWSPAS